MLRSVAARGQIDRGSVASSHRRRRHGTDGRRRQFSWRSSSQIKHSRVVDGHGAGLGARQAGPGLGDTSVGTTAERPWSGRLVGGRHGGLGSAPTGAGAAGGGTSCGGGRRTGQAGTAGRVRGGTQGGFYVGSVGSLEGILHGWGSVELAVTGTEYVGIVGHVGDVGGRDGIGVLWVRSRFV